MKGCMRAGTWVDVLDVIWSCVEAWKWADVGAVIWAYFKDWTWTYESASPGWEFALIFVIKKLLACCDQKE